MNHRARAVHRNKQRQRDAALRRVIDEMLAELHRQLDAMRHTPPLVFTPAAERPSWWRRFFSS